MNEDKWKDFEKTGKISDYLEYKGVMKSGEINGNAQIPGNSAS